MNAADARARLHAAGYRLSVLPMIDDAEQRVLGFYAQAIGPAGSFNAPGTTDDAAVIALAERVFNA
jgi:hypothetical protein